tara:strand:- start:160 stop:531 length:372 start_codon:yes stop_codon:yes gene_type:complete
VTAGGGVSPLFFPFVLSSAFFLPNPNNRRFPVFAPSPVPSTASCSASLLSAVFETASLGVSWNPSPRTGTFGALAGISIAGAGVLGCTVLDSDALILGVVCEEADLLLWLQTAQVYMARIPVS